MVLFDVYLGIYIFYTKYGRILGIIQLVWLGPSGAGVLESLMGIPVEAQA
jgi:hypothetical protein